MRANIKAPALCDGRASSLLIKLQDLIEESPQGLGCLGAFLIALGYYIVVNETAGKCLENCLQVESR